MRLASLTLVFFLALPAATSAQSVRVDIDQAARVRLSKPVHDVVVGNPAIADVTVMDSRHLLIIGKSVGITNLMVTDEGGRTIFNRQVAVGAPSSGHVSIYRGGDVAEYACAPLCQRTGGSVGAPAAPTSP